MKIISLIVVTMIAGCSGGCGQTGDGANNHGYGYSSDVSGASGIRIRYEIPGPSLQFSEAIFLRTRSCIQDKTGSGNKVSGPLVVFSDHITGADTGQYHGFTYTDNHTIVIIPVSHGVGYERADAKSNAYALAHEYIHYITLEANILSQDENLNHEDGTPLGVLLHSCTPFFGNLNVDDLIPPIAP